MAKLSKLAESVGQYADQLQNGYMLAIDPSSGSTSSLPGWAIFRQGKLDDAGTLELPRGTRSIANRLFLLRNALFTEFEEPDILVIEQIAPVLPSKNGAFLHKGASSLIKSVGAILSTWDVPTLEVAPMTWHSMTPPEYRKGDCVDSQMIGWAAMIVLARIRGEKEPRINLIGLENT